jgi:hypothetical protein
MNGTTLSLFIGGYFVFMCLGLGYIFRKYLCSDCYKTTVEILNDEMMSELEEGFNVASQTDIEESEEDILPILPQ